MPQFDILVVGAGLVGLATAIGLRKKGHHVRVVESATALSVVGDAIAVGANQQRVLQHFGILDGFRACAVKDLGLMNHRRYSTGEIISIRDMKTQEVNYGYASYILSRVRYQQYLFETAQVLGVKFQFNSRVETLEDGVSGTAVILSDGSRLEADIIVGADGVKSAIRRSIFPEIELTSQWNCFRATLPHEELKNDPELVELLTGIHFFMGPNRMVVQSNMTDIGVVSLNMYSPGHDGAAGAWKAPGDIAQLRKTFKDFCPQIQKMIHLVDECIVWKVVELPSLPSWRSQHGRAVLIGDAAHAMAPFQGQGCSTGVEDGGVLIECLAQARSLEDVPSLLYKYEQIRKPRVELIAGTSVTVGKIYSMPDGEPQRERDENMRKAPIWSAGTWDGKAIDDIPSGLKDPAYQPWVMSHDAIDYADRMLKVL